MPDLIHRARQRLLSRAELDEIAAKLEYQETFDELSDQLLAMQLAGDARYRRAVERYLSFRGRVTAAARALRVLCFDWKLTEDYFEWLIGFIEGVDWDLAFGTPEVRTQAFHLAGYHLQSTRSRRLLGLLVQVAEDPCEQPSNRGDAGRALMSAAGVPAREVPLELSTADPGWARAVRDARDRLRSEPEPPPTVERRPMPRLVQLPDYVGEFLPDPEAASDLVERARRNELPQAELSAVADALRRRASGPQVRAHLMVMLYAGQACDADAAQTYLTSAEPDVAGLALLVLCAGWKLTTPHLDDVQRLVRHGEPPQRRLALSIAGSYLATRRSRPLLELIVSLAEDAGQPEAVRAEALSAMHRAIDGFPGGLIIDLDEQETARAWTDTRLRLQWE